MAKPKSALFGSLLIAPHIEGATHDPEQANQSGAGVGNIEPEQPETGQVDSHPFQRVHLHAIAALKNRMAGGRGGGNGKLAARLRNPDAEIGIK